MKIIINSPAYSKLKFWSHQTLDPKLRKYYLSKKELDNGTLEIRLNLAELRRFHLERGGLIEIQSIQEEFSSLNRFLVGLCGEQAIQFDSDPSTLIEAAEGIYSAKLESTKIVLNDDLTILSSYHDLGKHVKAWSLKRLGKFWIGTLKHPHLVESDIENVQVFGFRIFAAEETLEKLSAVVKKAEQQKYSVKIKETADGNFILTYDEAAKHFEKDLLAKCQVEYNLGKETENLVFAKRIEDGVIKFSGFLLPFVLSTLKNNRITNIDIKEDLPNNFGWKMAKNFVPYTVQKEALIAWKNKHYGTLVLPTGAGKTLVGIMAIVDALERTLIVVPSIEIMDHWRNELLKWTNIPVSHIGTYSSERKEIGLITIVTYQSGHRAFSAEDETNPFIDESFLEEFEKLKSQFRNYILDEGHHSPAKIYRKIMTSMQGVKRMSLTATAERHDGNETLSLLACGPVVYKTDYVDLARQGIVCPIYYIREPVFLTEMETEFVYNLAKLRGDIPAEIARLRTKGASFAHLTAEKLSLAKKIRDLCKQLPISSVGPEMSQVIPKRKIFGFAENKLKKLCEIISRHKNSRIIIFNELRKGTRVIEKYLKDNGIDCEVLHGGAGSRTQRRDIFNNFSQGRARIIVTTTVLDEGINVPACDVGIVVNGSSAKLQMTQRVGRVARNGYMKIGHFYELVAQVDHRLYKPEYRDCKKFSDFSTYELKISETRDIGIDTPAMKELVENVLAKRHKTRATQ